MKKLIILGLCVLFAKIFLAQTTNAGKVQVVTKLVQKTIPIQSTQDLKITAKKAKIMITPSSDNQIHLKMSLIAKHTEKEKAEKDLQALVYEIGEDNAGIVLKNDIQKDKVNEKITSLLKTVYELQIPAQMPVKIHQNYGEIQIENVKSSLNLHANYTDIKLSDLHPDKADIHGNYSDIEIKNCSGKYIVTSNYGDVKVRNTNSMDFIGKINYGDVLLETFSGDANITANYSDVKMENIKEIKRLNIVSNYSDVVFKDTATLNQYGFDIINNFSDVSISETMRKDFVRTTNTLVKTATNGTPTIKIIANYGDINLK
jgi:hypothetical protein